MKLSATSLENACSTRDVVQVSESCVQAQYRYDVVCINRHVSIDSCRYTSQKALSLLAHLVRVCDGLWRRHFVLELAGISLAGTDTRRK